MKWQYILQQNRHTKYKNSSVRDYFYNNDFRIHLLMPFTAGTFIYVSAVDLVPEIKASHITKERLLHAFYFLLGIFFIYFLVELFHHTH